MLIAKTELEWRYTPANFFEAPYHRQIDDYSLVADAGKVLVTLTMSSDSIDAGLQSRITKDLERLFRLRQLLVHRPFELDKSPTLYQHGTGRKRSISVALSGAEFLSVVGQADFLIHDASGEFVKDTKSERITEDTKFIESVLPKLASSATLNALLHSYNGAVADPANELVHLYEIRERLVQHYGKHAKVRRNLQISDKDWNRLNYLANVAPLKEGRHRGKHSELRNATAAELDEARKIARCLIEEFANQL
jgi:hypothetical protein